MTKLDYEFSSVPEVRGKYRRIYMHVMALGNKLEDLRTLTFSRLRNASSRRISEEYGQIETINGEIQGTQYHVVLEHGDCPTMTGAEGHNVTVRTLKTVEDRLSPIIAERMRQYETEMNEERKRIEKFMQSGQTQSSRRDMDLMP